MKGHSSTLHREWCKYDVGVLARARWAHSSWCISGVFCKRPRWSKLELQLAQGCLVVCTCQAAGVSGISWE